jgi:hypothetical protein
VKGAGLRASMETKQKQLDDKLSAIQLQLGEGGGEGCVCVYAKGR